MSIKDWVREKEMLGGRFFTFEELRAAVPELSCQVVKNSLNRLRKSSRIYSPYRGFYVILPPEYVRRGGVPPTFYMDDFMKSVHRHYYFSLLSAATFWGAAHQRPQVDFVATDGKRLFAGVRERRDVEWIGMGIGMGRHLNCGGDFGAERRCFGELSKKQDDDMDNLKVWGQSLRKAHFTRV